MARSLFVVGRASRSGASTLPEFTLPTDDGVLRASLDVIPSQRTDPTRVVEFSVEVLLDGTWATLSAGRWQGGTEVATPTEEFPMVGGGLDLRGRPARWRLAIPSGSVNVGGAIELLTYAEVDAAAAREA